MKTCLLNVYKNSTGLALHSYFPPSSYSLLIHVIWSVETVTLPASQNPSWNFGLKSCLHRSPGLKVNRTQWDKTKGLEGFTKHGLHSSFPLSMGPWTLMLKSLQLSMSVSIEFQTRFVCCQYPFIMFLPEKNFWMWILVYTSSGKVEGFW